MKLFRITNIFFFFIFTHKVYFINDLGTVGTVKKWSSRKPLDSSNGGLDIETLKYILYRVLAQENLHISDVNIIHAVNILHVMSELPVILSLLLHHINKSVYRTPLNHPLYIVKIGVYRGIH